MNTPDISISMEFASQDLALSTALLSLGYELIELDKSEARRVKFVFAKNPQLDQAVQDYFNRALLIEPQSYFDCMKRLKNRLYGA